MTILKKSLFFVLLAIVGLVCVACHDDGISGGVSDVILSQDEKVVEEASSEPTLAPMPTLKPTQMPKPTPTPTPIPEAVDFTDILSLTLSDGNLAPELLDRDYTTKCVFGQDEFIEINAPENIFSMYLVWDLPPGQWALSNSNSQTFGENGFIHEYVLLQVPATDITLTLPTEGAILCDIYAFSEGYPPDYVQVWEPPFESADMIIMPTHADDEHLFFVGILPYYGGELGYDIQVAYMTNHWNEPPRPHELLNGLWVVGVRNYPIISDFADRYCPTLQDAQAKYGFDNFVDYQVGLLRKLKPSVVVGHDLDGEYSEGGTHKLSAHTLIEAVKRAADPEYHAESAALYGIWDTPKLYLHLYSENEIIMDWEIPLIRFDGATARDMAILGYDMHLSQHKWPSFYVRSAGDRMGSAFGLVRSTVGPDILGGDMFENIQLVR